MPLEFAGPAGRLEALLDEPADRRGVNREGLVEAGAAAGLRAAVVFAHPHPQYGGTMHTKVVYQSAKALARIGCAVLRFNFRGVGRSEGVFGNAVGEAEDYEAGLALMSQRYPRTPVWAAGMSFGAFVALSVGARNPSVSALIAIAPPLSRYDFEAVRVSTKPKFFVQGERDEICPLKAMREFYASAAEPKELVVIDAADHLFDGKAGDVGDALEELLGDWSTA
jgi:alpha/beta superfamily hydrolase